MSMPVSISKLLDVANQAAAGRFVRVQTAGEDMRDAWWHAANKLTASAAKRRGQQNPAGLANAIHLLDLAEFENAVRLTAQVTAASISNWKRLTCLNRLGAASVMPIYPTASRTPFMPRQCGGKADFNIHSHLTSGLLSSASSPASRMVQHNDDPPRSYLRVNSQREQHSEKCVWRPKPRSPERGQ